jgi:hypothetical protein
MLSFLRAGRVVSRDKWPNFELIRAWRLKNMESEGWRLSGLNSKGEGRDGKVGVEWKENGRGESAPLLCRRVKRYIF